MLQFSSAPTYDVDFSIEDGGAAAVPREPHAGTFSPLVLARVQPEDPVAQLVRLVVWLVLIQDVGAKGQRQETRRRELKGPVCRIWPD